MNKVKILLIIVCFFTEIVFATDTVVDTTFLKRRLELERIKRATLVWHLDKDEIKLYQKEVKKLLQYFDTIPCEDTKLNYFKIESWQNASPCARIDTIRKTYLNAGDELEGLSNEVAGYRLRSLYEREMSNILKKGKVPKISYLIYNSWLNKNQWNNKEFQFYTDFVNMTEIAQFCPDYEKFRKIISNDPYLSFCLQYNKRFGIDREQLINIVTEINTFSPEVQTLLYSYPPDGFESIISMIYGVYGNFRVEQNTVNYYHPDKCWKKNAFDMLSNFEVQKFIQNYLTLGDKNGNEKVNVSSIQSLLNFYNLKKVDSAFTMCDTIVSIKKWLFRQISG